MNDIEKIIGYKFNNIKLLYTALTHSSFAKDYDVESYERLEFLGDTVLQFAVTSYIFNVPSFNEGQLTRLRSSLVSTANLSSICDKLGLVRYIKLGKSLQTPSTSIREDVLESVIGAIYLDGGYNKAFTFILDNVLIGVDNIKSHYLNSIDYKTLLQEHIQKSGKNSIKYTEISSTGLDNDKTYTMGLYVDGELVATASGKSKQKAEELCAKLYYMKINK